MRNEQDYIKKNNMDKLPNVLCTLMDTLLGTNQLLSWRISGESNIILSLKFGQGEYESQNQGMQYFRPKSISSVQRDKQRQEDYWKSSKQERGGHSAGFTAGNTSHHAQSDWHIAGGMEGRDCSILTNVSPLECDIQTSTPQNNSFKQSHLGRHMANNTLAVETEDAMCGPDYCKHDSCTQSDNIMVSRVKVQTDGPKRLDKENMTKKIKFLHNHSQTDLKQYSDTSSNTELFVGKHKETKTFHPSRHVQTITRSSAPKSTMTVFSDQNSSTDDASDLHHVNVPDIENTPISQKLSLDICEPSFSQLTQQPKPQTHTPEAQNHQACIDDVDTPTDQPTKILCNATSLAVMESVIRDSFQEVSDSLTTTNASKVLDSMARPKASTDRRKARLAFYKAKSGIT
jgi:hypothetical protein